MGYLKFFAVLLVCMIQPFISFSQHVPYDSIITSASLQHIIEVLAADSLKGRSTGSMEIKKTADFIANEFYKAGISALEGNNGYLVPFEFLPGKT